jgi:hypothetical protein
MRRAAALVLALGAISLAISAAPALAGSASRGAEVSALDAYHSYLKALIAGVPSDTSHVSALVTSVTNECPEALANVSTSMLSGSALTALGEEVAGDVTLRFLRGASKPVAQLANKLSQLQWPTQADDTTAAALPAAEQALLALHQSHLCKDATKLNGEPEQEPAATRKFLAAYQRASQVLNTAVRSFTTLLSDNQTPSQAKAIASIDHLAARFGSESRSAENSGSQQILAALGLSG